QGSGKLRFSVPGRPGTTAPACDEGSDGTRAGISPLSFVSLVFLVDFATMLRMEAPKSTLQVIHQPLRCRASLGANFGVRTSRELRTPSSHLIRTRAARTFAAHFRLILSEPLITE